MVNKKALLDRITFQMEKDVKKLPLASLPQEIVPAEGNPEAEIMFIGEAAGYHELIQRRPFVGAAGRLLSEALRQNNFSREEVWISNVVKTRPPANRDPEPEEIEAFRPYLDKEIEIIKPRIIATLGRFSMAKFLGPTVKISQVHGQARWVNFVLPNHGELRVVVLPMYHPAAALRSTKVKVMFEKDFKKLTQILERLNKKRGKIKEEVPKVPKVSKVSEAENSSEQLSLI